MALMNSKVAKKLVEVIRVSTDKNVVVKAMIKLRTDLVKNSEGILLFLQVDGLKTLIKFLGKPHEQILEVALSIIANCCTENACCREALNNRIVSYLSTILKSIPNQIIQCRACRLLGNLARFDCNELIGNQSASIAQAICKIIGETDHLDTKIMGFRAVRFLLQHTDFMKHFLQEDGLALLVKNLTLAVRNENTEVELDVEKEVSPKMGLKQTQHREKYFEEVARNLEGFRTEIVEHETRDGKTERKFLNVFKMPSDHRTIDKIFEILRCLWKVSEIQINRPVWEALIRSSCSLSSLVFFTANSNSHRSMVLKTLVNFSKSPGAFYVLSESDAIVAACDLILAKDLTKPLNPSERRHCITLIYMLSADACHRAKVRRSGTLRTLIALLRDSKDINEKSLILYIFNNFQYDNFSLEMMLWNGLVPALTAELNAYLNSDNEYYKRRREERQSNSRKRKIALSSQENFTKLRRLDASPVEQSDESPSSSPKIISNPISASPSSCGSLSPRSSCGNIEEEDESYSPVCSDADDDDEVTADDGVSPGRQLILSCSEVMKLLDACQPSSVLDENIVDKDDDDEVSQDAPNGKSQTVFISRCCLEIVETLLFRVSLLGSKHDSLGNPEIMDILVQSLQTFGTHNNNISSCLANILGEKRFFERIIKSGMAHKLYILNKLEDARINISDIIEKLSRVAESYYGRGELDRCLRSETNINQQRAAISIAYVVRTHSSLYQLLSDGNVLTILLNLILNDNIDDLTIEAIESLTTMSRDTLEIKLPILDPKERTSNYGEYVETSASDFGLEYDIKFMVYKGSNGSPQCIQFNKNLLCDASEVFQRMLSGSFRESTEGIIKMQDCTPAGLRYFLDLIVSQAKNGKINIPACDRYELILEAFEMSRIYMMPQIELNLLDLLVSLMNEHCCLSVLNWALTNYHIILTETAINYYLSAPLEANKKIKLFRQAAESSCSSQWKQLIRDTVLDRCRHGLY